MRRALSPFLPLTLIVHYLQTNHERTNHELCRHQILALPYLVGALGPLALALARQSWSLVLRMA